MKEAMEQLHCRFGLHSINVHPIIRLLREELTNVRLQKTCRCPTIPLTSKLTPSFQNNTGISSIIYLSRFWSHEEISVR